MQNGTQRNAGSEIVWIQDPDRLFPRERWNDIGRNNRRVGRSHHDKIFQRRSCELDSEAGRVTGKIIRVHHEDFDYKGHRHRASKDDPQYEIKSDKTDHIAAHKEGALTKIK
jgi:hypothetical protein